MNKETKTKQKTNKQTNKRNKEIKKIPLPPGTIEFQSLFNSGYSFGIQSWYWYVSRSSEVVSPGDWLMSSVLFFFLPV
jgi:hypothetical protein